MYDFFISNKATSLWILVELLIIFIIALFLLSKKSSISISIQLFFESMYNFFEEIIWTQEKKRIKSTIITIFFVVLLSNLLWRFWDIVAQWYPELENIFWVFSSNRNGTFAMSTLIVLLTIIIQLVHLWPLKFFHEYLPITWKNYIKIDKWKMKKIVYYPLFIIVKICDIWISMFIWILDIIWTLAKTISLSFRLYWNMFAWTTLLFLITKASSSLTTYLIDIKLPIILPLILFIQWLLVAFIQAFVVALLTSIFVKMAKN